MSRVRFLLCLSVVGLVNCGCSSQDERLADFAQHAADQQAAQNERVAETSHLVAESHERLIEADAQSRTELIALQQDLRDDQAEVGRLRDELEVERREIVAERRTDSATGAGLIALALMIACLSPLLLAAASVWGLFCEPRDGEIGALFAEELTRMDTTRLSGPARESRLPVPTEDEIPRLPE